MMMSSQDCPSRLTWRAVHHLCRPSPKKSADKMRIMMSRSPNIVQRITLEPSKDMSLAKTRPLPTLDGDLQAPLLPQIRANP